MTAEFLKNFFTIALSHRLGNEITHTIGEKDISPENLYISRLIHKVGLISERKEQAAKQVIEATNNALEMNFSSVRKLDYKTAEEILG